MTSSSSTSSSTSSTSSTSSSTSTTSSTTSSTSLASTSTTTSTSTSIAPSSTSTSTTSSTSTSSSSSSSTSPTTSTNAPTTSTVRTSSTTTTTLPCSQGGFAGLRCVLAEGLVRPGCEGETLPLRVQRRFARALRTIDKAELATTPRKARKKLLIVARLLEKTAGGVRRQDERGRIDTTCAALLGGMLDEGQGRAAELAETLG
jgi:hypothetical protein